MYKFKVIVYAICKNEEKFVKRWVESMKEADQIYVLDTGSIDNTVKLLEENGVIVKQKKYKNWRFDIARNDSLNMVPDDADICVCTDLDEVFQSGWRSELEKIWCKDSNRVRYIYNWKLDDNNKPEISFYYEKIHSRKNYKWIYPVHEILKYDGKDEKYIQTDNIILNHYPDSSKSRSSYLPLLELSVKENPLDDRNMHYLGREYMYYGKWNESIDTLIKHLSLKNATWKDERCASMRFISRCYINLNRFEEAKMWLEKAIKEAPYLRDPYIEKALLSYQLFDYNDVYINCKNALKIEKNNKSYINETFCWDNTIYDLLSIASYYLGYYDESLEYVNKALEMDNTNERLIKNKKLIEEKTKKTD